jgi:hypothetical protein
MSREVDDERVVKVDESATQQIRKALNLDADADITPDHLASLKQKVGRKRADELHNKWRLESLNY